MKHDQAYERMILERRMTYLQKSDPMRSPLFYIDDELIERLDVEYADVSTREKMISLLSAIESNR